jgi:membrane protein implicated in regulation of membrane protease activity
VAFALVAAPQQRRTAKKRLIPKQILYRNLLPRAAARQALLRCIGKMGAHRRATKWLMLRAGDHGGSMAAHWVWWIFGVVLIGAELVTGTFYLFAAGIACLAGGLIAWAGAPIAMQLLVTAILAIVGTLVAHRVRLRRATPAPMPSLDVGQPVQVQFWHPNGTARVTYRGTQWDAQLAQPDGARANTMYIVATRGSTLIVSAQRPA